MLFGAHTSYFTGMSPEESSAMLDQLLRHSTQEEFVYTHRWRRYDLLMWNNRRVLHRVLPYGVATDRRRLWRAEVVGGRRPRRWPQSMRELFARF
jgi:alpha-ketoglutarate-dependent taurine dioxygenase